MALALILPWFPVVLAVGIAGRLLGQPRGLVVGVLCGVFWIVLVHASEGSVLWQNPWAVVSILVGAAAIAMVGAWAGSAGLPAGSPPPVMATDRTREPESDADRSGTGLAELSGILARFDDWLEPYRSARDGDPWPDFGEFIRTALFQSCRAAHVRPYRVANENRDLVPLRNPDPLAADACLSARQGVVGHVVTTGRMFIAGDPRQGELVHRLAAGSEPVAWCFAVSHGNQRLGAVVVGQLDINPQRHRPLLEASARVIGQCWAMLSETVRSRQAIDADPVSGLPTREAFLQLAGGALRESYAQGEPAAVAIVAVEGLRELNDTGRWELADELVRDVAGCLRNKLRTDDRVGRFDDSRFVVLLRRVDSQLGALIVEQLLGRLQSRVEDPTRWRASLTVRFGLSGSGATRPELKELVSAALSQCTRARIEGLALATDVAASIGTMAERT